MKHCILAGSLLALALPALGASTLPFQESFYSSLGQFTVVDANRDGRTFDFQPMGVKVDNQHPAFNQATHADADNPADWYLGEAEAFPTDDYRTQPMDDWLISPGFELRAGYVYTLAVDLRSGDSTWADEAEIMLGSAADPSQLTTTISAKTKYSHVGYKTVSRDISVAQDGTYFIGIHCNSMGNRRGLRVQNFSLSAGRMLPTPAAVTNLQFIPSPDGKPNVTLKFNAPSKDRMGNDLTSNLTAINIYVDGKTTPEKTFSNVAPGAACEHTDYEYEAGFHTFAIQAENANGKGETV